MHPRWAREKPATRTPHQLGRDQPEKGPPPARGPGEGQPRGAEGVLTPVLTQPTPQCRAERGAGRLAVAPLGPVTRQQRQKEERAVAVSPPPPTPAMAGRLFFLM